MAAGETAFMAMGQAPAPNRANYHMEITCSPSRGDRKKVVRVSTAPGATIVVLLRVTQNKKQTINHVKIWVWSQRHVKKQNPVGSRQTEDYCTVILVRKNSL